MTEFRSSTTVPSIVGAVFPGHVSLGVLVETRNNSVFTACTSLKRYIKAESGIELVTTQVGRSISNVAHYLMVKKPESGEVSVPVIIALRASIRRWCMGRSDVMYIPATGFYSNATSRYSSAVECVQFIYDIYDEQLHLVIEAGDMLVKGTRRWESVVAVLDRLLPDDEWHQLAVWGTWKQGV